MSLRNDSFYWGNYDKEYRVARSLMKAEKSRERRNRRRAAKKRNIGNQWN